MAKKKVINRIAKATANKLLVLVCKYYGIGDIKQLAGSARPDLWRYPVLDEARQIACWIIRRHCDLPEEELQATLKQLQWNCGSILLAAEKARLKLAEGDFEYRMGVQGIEQLLMQELGGRQRRSNASTKRNREGKKRRGNDGNE